MNGHLSGASSFKKVCEYYNCLRILFTGSPARLDGKPLELADKIIYLDIPIQVRKRRILLRYIKQKLKIEKSNYRPNKEMLKNMYKWTNEFENNKIELEEEILKYKEKLIVLKSKRKIKLYKLNLV